MQILEWDKFNPSESEIKSDPVLSNLTKVVKQPCLVECLMHGARLVTKPQTAIHILAVALGCVTDANWNVIGYLLTELVKRMTVLVSEGTVIVYGSLQLLKETEGVIDRLQKLLNFIDQHSELSQN